MPMWRCPHCGTPQAETARCWVCRRSSTTCSTCRQFRRSIAGQLGYCGLDRRRLPLLGSELRGCWEPGPVRAFDSVAAAVGSATDVEVDDPAPPSPALRLRDFVPVELEQHRAARARRARRTQAALPAVAPESATALEPRPLPAERGTLFADAEL
jgi:hypothetical protein